MCRLVFQMCLALCIGLNIYGCSSTQPTTSAAPIIDANQKVDSFGKAKKLVYQVFRNRSRTFYCDCPYTDRQIETERCGFKSERYKKRSGRTEIEHVVPAHAFGQSFGVWRNGHKRCVDSKGRSYKGRRCAKKVSSVYRKMSADLYNLRPSVGAVNALRKNFRMALLAGEPRDFGTCDVEVLNGKFEPRESIRGEVARTYFYMEAAYPNRGIISKSQRKLLIAWHRLDPVDEDELALAKEIQLIQGNENPFVTRGLSPFWAGKQ